MQGEAGHSSVFYFDHYWWMIYLVIFGALLASSFTYRIESYCKNGRVLRHDIYARAGHWLNASGILILLYSGYKLGFLWFGRTVAGTDAIRFMFNLHFIGAALFLLGAVFWLGNMFLSPQRLDEHEPYKGAIKDAVLHYLHLFGFIKHAGSPTGKYEASERLAFVPLTVLAFFMALTGLVKMTGHVVHLPTSLLHIATLAHDYSGLVLAVLLVFHIFLAAVAPWAWPMMRSMIDGYVPLEYVKKTHRAWYEELVAKGACKEEKQ